MNQEPRDHWDRVFLDKPHDSVSWYASAHGTSLRLVEQFGAHESRIVDVGAGAGSLVDELLDAGFEHVTAHDIAPAALEAVRARTAARPVRPSLVVADVLSWRPAPASVDVWHDRAVFHFMVDQGSRDAYRATLAHALAPGGAAIIGTFADDGPAQCSGLPVARYAAEELAAEFPGFTVRHSERELHTTPSETIQPFTWLVIRRALP